jgi:hypothetical protein
VIELCSYEAAMKQLRSKIFEEAVLSASPPDLAPIRVSLQRLQEAADLLLVDNAYQPALQVSHA